MRRRNTSKAAAAAASANARAAVSLNTTHSTAFTSYKDSQAKTNNNVPWLRIFIATILTILFLKWALTPPKDQSSTSLVFPSSSELGNLSIIPAIPDYIRNNITQSFDEFYGSMVQPLLDRGLSAFNGTRHVDEENLRVGYRLRHGLTMNRNVCRDNIGNDKNGNNDTIESSAANKSCEPNNQKGAYAKHPIILVPGFVTSGIELWEGTQCAKKHFRQRLWGSASMARTFFSDRDCWRKHLSLDPITGMDPPNIRLRSAQGFEAADNFIATYWVWSKLIENLADVGYDGSKMAMMSYDWRMGYEFMEKRDGYFTKLKHCVEAFHITTGEKVVLVSHSMGGTVVFYFLQWVVANVKDGGGGGGKNWVEKYIHAFVNIAGTLLGVPKALPALLSGELKDTAVLFSHLGELLEEYFGRRWRKNLWNTWGSLFGMLPKGGDAIWGIGADVEEDKGNIPKKSSNSKLHPTIIWNNGTEDFCPSTTPSMNKITPLPNAPHDKKGFTYLDLDIPPSRNWTMKQTLDYIFANGGGYGSALKNSAAFAHDAKKGWRASSKEKRKYFQDPVASPLPKAPSLKVYCLYGVGIPTERSYYYKVSCDKLNGSSTIGEENNQTCSDSSTTKLAQTSVKGNPLQIVQEPPEAPFQIDTSAIDATKNIEYGVHFSDGDGSVPLISLGYMCQKWATSKSAHNPSGSKVFTRERKHEAEVIFSDPGRGGPFSGEHVDILGNVGVIEDVVRIATGFEVEEKVDKDLIVSDLKRITEKLDSHPLGGLKNAIH